MIVTKSWLREWIDLNGISTDDLAKKLNSIGLEVDRIHSYKIPSLVVFGKVLECEKHPDADKLNVCKVDVGTQVLQIVCGASNVRAGLFVAVATLGATMPNGLLIQPVELRGVASQGMICSASEIGLPDFQKGIIELDGSIGKITLGEELCTNSLFNDDLIEIELTANRGDCLSIRGIARDLSAAYDRPLKECHLVESENKRGIGRILHLDHEKDFHVNIRYKAVDIKNLSLPLIVKLRLSQIEETGDTDIESLMLYATHASGVILKAYEYDFFRNDNEVMAHMHLSKDENGYDCIMSHEKASVIGVIQEDVSKVKHSEGTILVEASYIPPDFISKKMALTKIPSGPMFYRTSRGSEPELNLGLDFCLHMIESHSSSSVFSGTIELGKKYDNKIVIVTKQEIDDIIGTPIEKTKITKILKNLGFDTSKSQVNNYVITVPQYRHDIANKQDIVEEIVRLVGIDNIPSKPFILAEKNRLEDDYYTYKKRSIFRHRAAQSGFFETVHFVFDEKKVLNSYGFETTLEELELVNPIVSTLDTLRPTLMTGLLRAASQNVKNGHSSVRLFELGSVFSPSREESVKLSMLFCGDKESQSLCNAGKPSKVDFAFFVQKIADIIGAFELQAYKTTHSLAHIFQSAQVVIGGEVVGELFGVHPEVQESYDLDTTFMCELDFSKLHRGLKTAKKVSKFQSSSRDLSIIVPQDMSYEKIKSVLTRNAPTELVNFYPVDKYSNQSLGENISLSLRFVLQSNEKTLEEEDITSSMNQILEALNNELGIRIR